MKAEELKSLDLKEYYDAARRLRLDLTSDDAALKGEAQRRFHRLESHQQGDGTNEIFSLREAKQVIALEHGFPDWPDFCRGIDARISELQEQCDGRFVPTPISIEPGEVVQGDLIVLGVFGGRHYVVDAILMDLYTVTRSEHGPGCELMASEPIEFNPDSIPDLPEMEEDWPRWSQQLAKALGLES